MGQKNVFGHLYLEIVRRFIAGSFATVKEHYKIVGLSAPDFFLVECPIIFIVGIHMFFCE